MTVHQNSPLPKESFTDTVKRLAGAQKPPAKGSPAYSRFINRKIGRVIAAAAYQVGLTPNQVTFISAGFSAASIAAIALAHPHWWVGILIAIGLLVGYAFDSADGQLARLRGGGTPAGEWLDHVVDSIKTTALHLAVLIGWYRHYDVTDIELLLIPIAFTLTASVFFFVQILTDQLRRAHPDRAAAPADSSAGATLRSILVIPTDYGVLCGIFVLFAWPSLFAAAYALLLLGTTLFLCAALPKWYREIRNFRNST